MVLVLFAGPGGMVGSGGRCRPRGRISTQRRRWNGLGAAAESSRNLPQRSRGVGVRAWALYGHDRVKVDVPLVLVYRAACVPCKTSNW